MLKNYIKMAFKVMLRRKFFTAVSLFGISFTIMTFTCIAAMFDLMLGPSRPSMNRDRTLYFLDMTLSKDGQNQQVGKLGYNALGKQLYRLKTPELVSLSSQGFTSSFKDGKYAHYGIQYTDHAFWTLEQFDFLEGRPFNAAEIKAGKKVAVITRLVRDHFFGAADVCGKYLDLGQERYQVTGVVENINFGIDVGFSAIWVPLSLNKEAMESRRLTGPYQAFILAKDRSDFDKIKAEINKKVGLIKMPDPSNQNKIEARVVSAIELARELSGEGMFQTMAILLLLFMLLPALNLMAININRISERGSEIGIRKAFGASSSVLVSQFITENIILTLLGGVIGFMMCAIAADWFVEILNAYSPGFKFQPGQFRANWRIISYTLAGSIFFGLLSGVYPAWRMSRLHVIEGLKGGDLC